VRDFNVDDKQQIFVEDVEEVKESVEFEEIATLNVLQSKGTDQV